MVGIVIVLGDLMVRSSVELNENLNRNVKGVYKYTYKQRRHGTNLLHAFFLCKQINLDLIQFSIDKAQLFCT